MIEIEVLKWFSQSDATSGNGAASVPRSAPNSIIRAATHHPRRLDNQHLAIGVGHEISIGETVHPLGVVTHAVVWFSSKVI